MTLLGPCIIVCQFLSKVSLFLQAPASEIQDKISFIINNLSATNFEAKAKEFTEILKEQYYPWFAQYMVMKRLVLHYSSCVYYISFSMKKDHYRGDDFIILLFKFALPFLPPNFDCSFMPLLIR